MFDDNESSCLIPNVCEEIVAHSEAVDVIL